MSGTPRCQETCQARQNVRCQGFRAACSALIPSSSSSSMPVKACQGKIAVSQGVKVLFPGVFGEDILQLVCSPEILKCITAVPQSYTRNTGRPGGSSG